MPTFCHGCDLLLADEGATAEDAPCPKCGSLATVEYAPGKEFDLRFTVRGGSLVPGTKKRLTKSIAGDSFFTKDGRMHYVTRHINKINNTYYERIIDKETGQVVREVSEPLSAHTGRGSARPDKKAARRKGAA